MNVNEMIELMQAEDYTSEVVVEGITTRHPLYRITGVNKNRSGEVGGIVLTIERIPGENTIHPTEKQVLTSERDKITKRLRNMRARDRRELQYKITVKSRADRSPAENLILDVMTDMGLRKRSGRRGRTGMTSKYTPKPRKKKSE